MSDHDRQYDDERVRQLFESRLHRRELGIDLDQATAMAVLGGEKALTRGYADLLHTFADLLHTFGNRSRLVEVKSAGGMASERAYDDLVRHLDAWPHLAASVSIEGGAFVLNHEHKQLPSKILMMSVGQVDDRGGR
jgi:hypothetical protein